MNQEIKKYVITCDLFQRVKPLNVNMTGEFNLVKSEGPGDLVTVDFFGPLPKSVGGVAYIFVFLDAFSKYVKLYTIKKETTEIALKKLFEHYIPELGKPKRILADNGTQFTSRRWIEGLQRADIQIIYSSVRHPQGNPTERVMR